MKGGYVPCGKCPNCLANQRQEWVFRLRSEYLNSKFSLFVTLTYDPEHYPATGTCKRDVQLFLKRLRKACGNKSFRYYIVSEYGDHTCRGHYHGIFFFTENSCFVSPCDELYDIFTKSWNNGFLKFGEPNEARIVYVTKYCLKNTATPPGALQPFRLVSKCPGLGEYYVHKYAKFHLENKNLFRAVLPGVSCRMPRYFKTQISKTLTPYEKEELQHDLDKMSYRQQIGKMGRQYFAYLRLKNLNDTEEAWNSFVAHDTARRERQAELVTKHCKKQQL